MATRKTHGELPDVSVPDDYLAHHPEEHPEDWGWHGEFGKWTAVAGWIVAVILVLMMLPAHYNGQGTLSLGLSAGAIVVGLLIDRQRRKNAWRN